MIGYNIGYVLVAVVGYLMGSVPFGLLITRAAGLGDVRKIGSGSIGATNVLRTGRRELAALTLLLDALKGTAAVLIARYLVAGYWLPIFSGPANDPEAILIFRELCTYIAAIAVFLGHCYPIWLRFKGGKGVATMIGILLGLAWPVGLVFCAVWLIVALGQRVSSLSAITAAITAPIFAYSAWLMGWAEDGVTLAAVTALLAILLVYNHRTNIGRLLNGTEPKIGKKAEPS